MNSNYTYIRAEESNLSTYIREAPVAEAQH